MTRSSAWTWLLLGGLAVLTAHAHAASPKADVIEDVNAKQLEDLVAESDYVAVFWYKKSCKDCDKVLQELENIDDDTDRFGVHFVKIADKKIAKSYGVKTFPALSFFRNKEPMHYEGDLMDESGVLEFLTSLEAMELPDQIEEVNAKILDKIVEEQEFVAVLFYKSECRRCAKALQELENVDDDADQLGIAFVKINDPELADEYSLGSLPALVYYRRRIPVVYDGDLMNEDKVLEWLVENKNTGDDDDVIDDVTLGLLNTLIDSLDHLAVVFYDRDENDDSVILHELENIDDDLDAQGIHIVKIADDVAMREYGIEDTPCLVYFEKEIPSLYDGDLHNEEEVLAWLIEQLHSDEIEDITDEMLDKLIREANHLAVLFYDEDSQESQLVVAELENIDDECDAKGISFVKIDNDDEAKEYGIDTLPTLVYFEKGVPSVYSGNLLVEEEVLDWLVLQVEEDEIEEVTDEMLDRLIGRTEHLAVLFYDKESRRSRKVLAELENIDDECDGRGVYFVKIDNYAEAMEYGIDTIPTLVYFESEIPYIFEGDLMKEEEVLYWLFHHVDHEEIADVTDEMLGKLIANEPFLAVLFYDKDDAEDHEVLGELENIDDDCEQAGVPFVKIDNDAEAKEYGIDELPTLVYFENRIPSIYEGDLSNEQEVLAWLLEQKTTDTIEEVTDEILDDLIANFEYVVVYFSGRCEEGQKCDKILDELENIDDDTDDHGMHFVTTEETGLAQEYGIKTLPALVLFRNGEPVLYKGDISNEEAVLKWVTSEETLQIPNQIEEVNQRMLERILNVSDNVAVFFYDEDDMQSKKILIELENIDDDCDDIGIDFVKISDEGIAQEYDIASMPALVYFRHRFPQIYEGDMFDEDALLEWLIDNKDKGPASIIEEVDGKMLQTLVDTFEYLVVYFYDDNCPTCETVLAELETIDDETDEVGIQFVKTNDVDVAEDLGISHLPALVYFEGGVPSIYDGDIARGREVLSWLVAHSRPINISVVTITSRLLGPGAEEAGESVGETVGASSGGGGVGVDEDEETDSNSDVSKMDDVNTAADEDDRKDSIPEDCLIIEEIPSEDDGDDSDSDAQGQGNISEDDGTFGRGSRDDCIKGNDNNGSDENAKTLDETSGKDDATDDEDSGKETTTCKHCEEDGNGVSEKERINEEHVDSEDKGAIYEVKADERQEENDKIIKAEQNVEEKAAYLNYNKLNDKNESHSSKVPLDHKNNPAGRKDAQYKDQEHRVKENKDDSGKKVESDDGKKDKHTVKKRKKKTMTRINETVLKRQKMILAKHINSKGDKSRGSLVAVKSEVSNKTRKDYGAKEYLRHKGDIQAEEEVLEWLIEQRHEDTIENINRQMLYTLVDTQDYLAVYFFNEENDECPKVLRTLEKIDDEAAEYGIQMVKMNDRLMAKKYGFRNPPGLVYFRKGKHIKYDGDLYDEEDVLDWLTAPENMELNDAIEKVNRKMFERIRQTTDYLAVFFYTEEGCKQCQKVLAELENIDDEADANGIDFVKIDDPQLARDVGVYALPAIVFYRTGSDDPIIYAGDMKNEENLLAWLLTEKDPTADFIEDMDGETLQRVIRDADAIAVYFYKDDSTCAICLQVLEELENIDDDTDRIGVSFVKTQDLKVAERYGVTSVPALLYFEHQVPTVYEGDLLAEEDVLQWLILQKTEDTIETVNRNMLEVMLEDTQYLAVFFYKPNCRACETVLAELENIDDECDLYGIHMVKIQDAQLAKRYGIKTLPALIYFRNGNPLIFDGDMQNEGNVLEWLKDDDNRDLDGEIEAVNTRMLKRLLDESPFMAVFFYEDDCTECEQVLQELENIDEEVDMYGIDFVKINDPDAAQRFNILHTPALVYFRKKVPLVYDGDLLDEEKVFQWLTSQDVFEIKDEIEEVNRKMLEKLLDENDFVAVYFYEDNAKCQEVLNELEKIDDETDDLDITFVKIRDTRYAKKYGIQKLPALVYFRRRFPSIYRGDLMVEEEVLEWLQKNRFKHPELNLFMYATGAITLAFIMYTLFLIFCFRSPAHQKAA